MKALVCNFHSVPAKFINSEKRPHPLLLGQSFLIVSQSQRNPEADDRSLHPRRPSCSSAESHDTNQKVVKILSACCMILDPRRLLSCAMVFGPQRLSCSLYYMLRYIYLQEQAMMVNLAVALENAGISVLRFDFSGNG